ncbi:MCE family protein [Candidatus Dependentiae bacterium]|nr:MCE family protein [Candidatus Dependentiae bacterium]
MQIKTETKVGLFVIIAIAIFIAMTIGIGAFRFSSTGYVPYKVSFDDVSGLSKKAEVKISGVKVGWIENIELLSNGKAQADIMVNKKYNLYDNAYAIVRQEGLIGTKYLELVPGDPMLPKLPSGNALARPGREAVSVDELLFKFKNIATHVEQVTDSIKEAFTGQEKSEQLKSLIENLANASAKIDRISSSLDHVFTDNEDNLKKAIQNISSATMTLKDDLPALKDNLTTSTESLTKAADEAHQTFSSITSISQKIDDGKGLLGKLINEDDMYRDIKTAVNSVKNYLAKVENMSVIVDAHSENMHRPVDQFKFTDSKGYFNLRLCTNGNSFYMGQIATSEKGFVERRHIYNTYMNSRENTYEPIPYDEIPTDPENGFASFNRREFSPYIVKQERKQFAYGFQFGKIYNNFAMRVGLFEGTFGVGADYFIPLSTEKLSWITSLEAFDFKGQQRLEFLKLRRPHLKWLNRVFIFNNIYTTFGFDDFVSQNATAFFGFGIRFADNDIKYLISKLNLSFAS